MASASGAPAPVTVDIVGKVGVLTLNRPKRLNAWTGPMVRARHWHAAVPVLATVAAAAVQEIIGTELGYRALRAVRGTKP